MQGSFVPQARPRSLHARLASTARLLQPHRRCALLDRGVLSPRRLLSHAAPATTPRASANHRRLFVHRAPFVASVATKSPRAWRTRTVFARRAATSLRMPFIWGLALRAPGCATMPTVEARAPRARLDSGVGTVCRIDAR